MRKHVAGFVFFVLIVALFAVGYSVVRNYMIPNVEAVVEPDETPGPDLYPDGEIRAVRVTQAIADPAARTLAFSLADGGNGVAEVELAFYNVNAEGVRFVRSEVVKASHGQWTGGNASRMITFKTDWLAGKHITDNLYVVAGARSPEQRSYAVVPFSSQNATAVLIAKN